MAFLLFAWTALGVLAGLFVGEAFFIFFVAFETCFNLVFSSVGLVFSAFLVASFLFLATEVLDFLAVLSRLAFLRMGSAAFTVSSIVVALLIGDFLGVTSLDPGLALLGLAVFFLRVSDFVVRALGCLAFLIFLPMDAFATLDLVMVGGVAVGADDAAVAVAGVAALGLG